MNARIQFPPGRVDRSQAQSDAVASPLRVAEPTTVAAIATRPFDATARHSDALRSTDACAGLTASMTPDRNPS